MKKIILWLAIILGLLLRVVSLDATPNGMTWDEAAIGYNAYSLIKTAHDEHGAFMPLIFKSFGDYKPGFYIYITVPFVALFGLNEYAVRLPNALFGTLLIYVVYLLTKRLSKGNQLLSVLSAFVIALSPWAVHFSRGAWEVNVFVCLLSISILYYFKFIDNESTIFPSIILASITLVLYQAAKMLTPLFFLLIFFVYKDKSLVAFKKLLVTKQRYWLIPFILFGLWLLFGVLFGEAGNRLATLSILGYKPKLANTYYDNQILLHFKLILSRYLYHFSPEVLFYGGTKVMERAHIPFSGLLNPLEVVPLMVGLYFISQNFSKKAKLLLFGLLMISPIPASLTLAEYSPLRALFMIVPLSIISGSGFYYLISRQKIFSFVTIPLYLVCTVYIFDLYFYHSSSVFALEFNDGYKQAIEIIKENPTDKVVFTDVYGQPYIYYLFYTAYDPQKYQNENDFISGGLDVGRVGRVGNVEFHQFGNNELENQRGTLFIGTEGNISKNFDIASDNVALFKQIETKNKKIIFRAVITK